MAESPLPSGGLTGPALVDTRPSSEPLGAGARVYGCLFDAVGDIIQVIQDIMGAACTEVYMKDGNAQHFR